MDRICLLDLNYTLVRNQVATKTLRPFSRRLAAEEYRTDLVEAVRGDHIILITARPDRQQEETLANILRKTGWQPQEWYFNDIDAWPPAFKKSALQRFIFPKHGENGSLYYAVESNPRTRAMYAKFGIAALPYEVFIQEGRPGEDNH